MARHARPYCGEGALRTEWHDTHMVSREGEAKVLQVGDEAHDGVGQVAEGPHGDALSLAARWRRHETHTSLSLSEEVRWQVKKCGEI